MKVKSAQKFKILSIVLMVCMLTCILLVFTACDKTDDDTTPATSNRGLYLDTIDFDAENKIAYVTLTFSGDTQNLVEGVTSSWNSQKRKVNAWYNESINKVFVNPSSIYSAVEDKIPQENLVYNEELYEQLKVRLRYDTIYKSIKSDGERLRNVTEYSHYFYLDENADSQVFTLTMKSQNSANWYSMLIGCAILFIVLCVVIFLASKGKLWQKKQKM